MLTKEMLHNMFNICDMFFNFIQGLLAFSIPVIKFFFTMPMLPFTILGLIGFCIKKIARR